MREYLFEVTLHTLFVGIGVALLSGFLGITLAWLVDRTDVPGFRSLGRFLTIPYALPPYLLAMAWVVLGNPTVGLIRGIFPEHGTYGLAGIICVLGSIGFAYPLFELRAGFSRLDPALEEAARMSGSGPLRTFFTVSLPLLWPALANGMCLAFIFAISAFGVPALLGLPVRFQVLTTVIYSQLRMGGMDGMSVALRTSLILLVMAAVVLAASALFSRLNRRRLGAIGGARFSRPSRMALGAVRIPAALFVWGFLGVAVALPWVALTLSALAPVAGQVSPATWTLSNLEKVLSLSDFHEGLVNSIGLAAGAALGIVSLGFLLAWAAERTKSRLATALIALLDIPFSLPGSLVALSLIVYVRVDSALLLLGIAYILKYAAVATRSVQIAIRQTHPALEEAARVSGAGPLRVITTIWIPLLKTTLFGGFLLSALPIFTELTMSVLLTGPGAQTLGTVLFQLQEYADQPAAAALAWLLLTTALLISIGTTFLRRPAHG